MYQIGTWLHKAVGDPENPAQGTNFSPEKKNKTWQQMQNEPTDRSQTTVAMEVCWNLLEA